MTYEYGRLLELVKELYPEYRDEYTRTGEFLGKLMYVLADETLVKRVGDSLTAQIKEKETN